MLILYTKIKKNILVRITTLIHDYWTFELKKKFVDFNHLHKAISLRCKLSNYDLWWKSTHSISLCVFTSHQKVKSFFQNIFRINSNFTQLLKSNSHCWSSVSRRVFFRHWECIQILLTTIRSIGRIFHEKN